MLSDVLEQMKLKQRRGGSEHKMMIGAVTETPGVTNPPLDFTLSRGSNSQLIVALQKVLSPKVLPQKSSGTANHFY